MNRTAVQCRLCGGRMVPVDALLMCEHCDGTCKGCGVCRGVGVGTNRAAFLLDLMPRPSRDLLRERP